MTNHILRFDIMLNEKFIHTMKLSMIGASFVDGFEPEGPVINGKKLRREVVKRLPSLKGKDFQMIFH